MSGTLEQPSSPPPSSSAPLDEINKLTEKNTRINLRRINESKLNKLLNVVPDTVSRNLIQRKLPKICKKRQHVARPFPKILRNVTRDLGLLDEPDVQRRYELFVGYCRIRDYSYNTVKTYVQKLKEHGILSLDGNDVDDDDGNKAAAVTVTSRPSQSSFEGNVQTRVVSIDDFIKIFVYLHENISLITAPLLVACYTGLRSMEILQFSTYTLFQLKSKQVYIEIRRKNTHVADEPVYWRPVYTSQFIMLIDTLIALYEAYYTAFINNSINTRLFNVTPATLCNRLRTIYGRVTGVAPPVGFGIHSCRYLVAMIMIKNSKNLAHVQHWLQHKSVHTTQRYVHVDQTYTKEAFDRITRSTFANLRNDIQGTSTIASSNSPEDAVTTAAAVSATTSLSYNPYLQKLSNNESHNISQTAEDNSISTNTEDKAMDLSIAASSSSSTVQHD